MLTKPKNVSACLFVFMALVVFVSPTQHSVKADDSVGSSNHRIPVIGEPDGKFTVTRFNYPTVTEQGCPIHKGTDNSHLLDINVGSAGYDFGEPVYASVGGLVIMAGSDSSNLRGTEVQIHSHDEITHRYIHLANVHVKEGNIVSKGDLIGWIGNTGNSFGSHLHWEIAPKDSFDVREIPGLETVRSGCTFDEYFAPHLPTNGSQSCSDYSQWVDNFGSTSDRVVTLFDHRDCRGKPYRFADEKGFGLTNASGNNSARSIYIPSGKSVWVSSDSQSPVDGAYQCFNTNSTSLANLDEAFYSNQPSTRIGFNTTAPDTEIVPIDNMISYVRTFSEPDCKVNGVPFAQAVSQGSVAIHTIELEGVPSYSKGILWKLPNFGGGRSTISQNNEIDYAGGTGFSNLPNANSRSLQVPSGWSIITWDNDNRQGNFRCWSSSISNLQDHGWHNRIQSVEIHASNICSQFNQSSPGVYLFRNTGYSGGHCYITEDTDSLGDYCKAGGYGSDWNDRAKSVFVVGDFSLALFEDDDYGGAVRYYNGSDADFSGDTPLGPELASSIRIRRRNPCVVSLHQHGDFNGQSFCTDRAIFDLGHWGFNDYAQSLKINQSGYEVLVCEHSHFHGLCGRTTSNASDLNSIANGLREEASSIRICPGNCPSAASPPTLIAPADGTYIPPNTNIHLLWQPTGDARTHYVQVTGGDLGNQERRYGWTESLGWEIGQLPASNQPYYWQVKSWNDYGDSSYSAPNTFYVGQEPAIDNAIAISHPQSLAVTANEPFTISVVMQNTGNTTWTHQDGYSLIGQVLGTDGVVTSTEAVIYEYMEANVQVLPNHTVSFSSQLEVSSDYDRYSISWYVQRNGSVFGTPTDNIPINLCTPTTDWKVEYWNNANLNGLPLICSSVEEINFNWYSGSPDPIIPVDNFSARWTRTQYFDEGYYRFYVGRDDGARLWIDDVQVFDAWNAGYFDHLIDYYLPAGNHDIRLETMELNGWSRAIFYIFPIEFQSESVQGWTSMLTPASQNLHGSDFLSENDGWAVGDSNMLLQWNGEAWASWRPSLNLHAKDVSMLANNNVWIVGDNYDTGSNIAHFNGDWLSVPSPVSQETLNAITMLSSTNGWAVGTNGSIIRWTGSNWSVVSSPTTYELKDVAFISPNNGWAVGGGWNDVDNWYEGVVLHWDGVEWTEYIAHNFYNVINAVDFTSANNGWMVGGNALRRRWNGSEWLHAGRESDTMNWFHSLSMLSESEGWIGGETLGPQDPVHLAHWNGNDWIESASPLENDTVFDIAALSESDVWAFGESGLVMHYDGAIPTNVTVKNVDTTSLHKVWLLAGLVTLGVMLPLLKAFQPRLDNKKS